MSADWMDACTRSERTEETEFTEARRPEANFGRGGVIFPGAVYDVFLCVSVPLW